MNVAEILIIDDSRLELMKMEHFLSEIDGCQPTFIENPNHALNWCIANDPDLVVVDYQMPHLDGLGFIKAFREIKGREDTPLVMITASSTETVCVEALNGGANDFICKPVRKAEFLARVSNMLTLRRKQKKTGNMIHKLNKDINDTAKVVTEREAEIVNRLALAAEHRDNDTGMHIIRMAYYSLIIARNLGLPQEQQQMIFRAAPLHDVGKLGIADEILLKPGKLTPEEFQIMQRHTTIGGQILSNSASVLIQTAQEIAVSHHEKFDGSGYPKGLVGDAIPLSGRIIAVADVFDALTSERPYKEAWSFERAISYIKENSGTSFDPICVNAFFKNMDEIEGVYSNQDDISDFMSGELVY